MTRTHNFSLFVLLLVAGGFHPAAAQTDRATLEGTVSDQSGAVIMDARVKISAVATGQAQERATNDHGFYRFPGIAVGLYAVEVSHAGFKTKLVEDVELEVGETHTLDVPLILGDVSERVEVKGSSEPAERSTAVAASVIRGDQINNLPVNGRDWAGLTLLAPFAQDDGGGDQRTIRFAGRARDDNNFSFDGVDAGGIQEQAQKSQTRLQISDDAIEEYRVNSALYDAEYGTQAGGQINVVTKSGTNDYHGTVFGYLRNSVLDARNFNDPPAIPPFRMGQYGLTFGGPIVKDKTFFFIDYEGLRQFGGTTATAAVPTAAFLREVLVTGRSGVGGPSPQMCPILQSYPWRQSTGTVGGCAPRFSFPDSMFNTPQGDAENFTHVAATTVHEDTWLVRVDHKFSDKTTLYGRAQRDISLVAGPQGNALDELRTINHPANYFIALQHVFTPNVVNEVKVYVNRSPFQNPQASVLPYSVDTGNLFETINNDQADIEIGSTYGAIDNLTWTHGRHAFKTGMEVRRVRLNQGKTASNTLAFADDSGILTAQLASVTFTAPWCCHAFRRSFYMPYFQDEWKITPALTVNLGLRYEYYGVANEAHNATTVFDLNQFHGVCLGSHSRNVPLGVTPINTPPCPTNPVLYNTDYLNFDPRVSVAWAPGALQGRTVIRAGFGIYHGAAQNDDLNAGLESDTFTGSISSVPLTPPLEQAVPDTSAFAKTANRPRALQRQGRRDLYVEEWGLTIDHELPAAFLFTTSYLGSHGVRLFSRGAVNLCTSTPDVNLNCSRPLDPFYPDPTNVLPTLDPFGSVDIKRDIGSSSYDGLQFSLERRLTSGVSFQTRYTFSHSINDGSVGGGESNGPENVNCLVCDKGPSTFDVRHSFTANSVYQLPFGPGRTHLNGEGLFANILGGWELSGVGAWHTGHPLTVTYNVQPNQLPDGNDQTNQRPDITPGVPLYLPGGGKNELPWINPAAFQAPPQNTGSSVAGAVTRFGNEGNGVIRALHSWQLDLALAKETKLTERFELEFAVQVFNILNHTQLGDPHNLQLDYVPNPGGPGFITQPSTDFGVINTTNNFNNNNDNAASPNTGTGLPRQIQFMLRFKF
ncbi:MAG TPA: carboxypeptidase-like regulatory domain-containing protein [Candidatus Acidoferrales bacterium]|nr:carboxypeptidase-like regulatory domain-containing protein [Candidatus Acidoferrales bacterium]